MHTVSKCTAVNISYSWFSSRQTDRNMQKFQVPFFLYTGMILLTSYLYLKKYNTNHLFLLLLFSISPHLSNSAFFLAPAVSLALLKFQFAMH